MLSVIKAYQGMIGVSPKNLGDALEQDGFYVPIGVENFLSSSNFFSAKLSINYFFLINSGHLLLEIAETKLYVFWLEDFYFLNETMNIQKN